MKKSYFVLLALLAAALTVMLLGCSSTGTELDGMYVATFELNGGTLDLKSSNVSTNINYAYQPGSHIIDPTNPDWNYKLTRAGYNFTGWYKTAECRPEDKWDFATGTIDAEKLTLYAGWEKAIVYTFSVCYTDDSGVQLLGEYKVKEGDVFEDYRKYAGKRENFTAMGYFADAECTTAWDFKTAHPGGEADTDIRVYVDYIPGEWIVVDSFAELENAIGDGNIYLTADIDCGGAVLDFGGDFSYVFEGNNHKISNFTVEKSGGALMPSISVFQTLTEGSEIRNISFENVTFRLFDVDRAGKIKVAGLAKDSRGSVISNVSVTGTLMTNYTGEFPKLGEAFYEDDAQAEITNLTIEITVSVETKSE